MGLRLILLLIIVMAIGFTHVSILNSGTITFNLTPTISVEIAVAELVLIAFAAGAALVLLGTFVKDTVDSAKRWKERRKQAKKESARAKIDKARSLYFQEKYKAALDAVNSALSILPESREALILKAQILNAVGNIPEKIATLRDYTKSHPSILEGYIELARTYEQIGDYASAIDTLTPLAGTGENTRVLKYLRDLHIKVGNFKEAYDLHKNLAKKKAPLSREDEEKWVGLRFERARFLMNEGKYGESSSILKDLIKEKPAFTPPYVLLYEINREQDKFEDALEILTEGYRKTKNPVTLIKLEDLVIDYERPSSLLEIYENLLSESPSDFTLHVFYGKLLLRLEMIDEALEQLLKAENIDSDNSSVHIYLAEAYRRRQRYEDALNEYEKAFAYKKRYLVPFVCRHCGEKLIRWIPLCGNCGKWDTFQIDFGDTRHIQRLREEAMREVPVSDGV